MAEIKNNVVPPPAGAQLTSITDPGGNVWTYGYDASNDLTTLTDPNNHATTFAYNFADRASSVTQPDGTTEQLTAEQMNGLAAPGTGTPTNPATAVLLATGDQAQFTDANNNVWTMGLDWLGFGLPVATIDPLGDAALTYINSNGLAWLSSDALGRATRDFYDSQGNVTEEVAPDNTTQEYSYNSFGEVTQYTDQDGNVTTYTYSSFAATEDWNRTALSNLRVILCVNWTFANLRGIR
jgi:YD repeat-containing protein